MDTELRGTSTGLGRRVEKNKNKQKKLEFGGRESVMVPRVDPSPTSARIPYGYWFV